MTYSNVVGKTESRHGDKWGEVVTDTGPAAKMNNEINATLTILRNAAGATGPKLAYFAKRVETSRY
jgi:hypothetical protein